MQDFQSLCQSRRSYRKYTNQTVEQEKSLCADVSCGQKNESLAFCSNKK